MITISTTPHPTVIPMIKYSAIHTSSPHTHARDDDKPPYPTLFKANVAACIFHALLCVLALVSGVVYNAPFTAKFDRVWNSNVTTTPVVRSPTCNSNPDPEYRYPAEKYREWLECISAEVDAWRDSMGDVRLYSPVNNEFFSIKVWVLLVFFCALTSLSHFILCLCHTTFYTDLLNDRQQPLRWLEYTVTSSIMILVSAGLSNVTEFYLLLFLVLSNMFMQLGGGLVFEVLDFYDGGWPFAGKDQYRRMGTRRMNVLGLTKWFVYMMSWLVFVASFSLIFDAFYSITQPYFEFESGYLWEELFGFVKIINWTLFSLYFAFPAIHFAQILRYVDYATGELMYIVASFVAKGGLVTIYLYAAVARED